MQRLSEHLAMWWAALLSPDEAGRLVLSDRRGFTRLLALEVAVMYALYGISMGLFAGPGPACWSALKLPMLFLLSLAVCFPALYGLNCAYGLRLRFVACVRLLVLAVSANAAAVASYAPFSLFFALTTFPDGYTFLVFMHVVVFALAGVASLVEIALIFRATAQALGKQFQPAFLAAWSLLYILVGTQMSWALRPWIGDPLVQYQIIRARGGTFVEAAWDLIQNVTIRLGF